MAQTPHDRVDWILLEARIRSALREYVQQDISSFKTLRIIDENLAALTLRGNELPADNLSFTSFRNTCEQKADRVVGEEQDKIWQGTGVPRGATSPTLVVSTILHGNPEQYQTTCSFCDQPFDGRKRKCQAVSGEICCSQDCAVSIYTGD